MRPLLAALLACTAIILAACEKPDASHTTSPSAIVLLGTAKGSANFAPEGHPPQANVQPEGWRFDIGNVRFSKLETGEASLQVVMDMKAQPGPALELWFERDGVPLVQWQGGRAHSYDGVVCFQLQLEQESSGEALALEPGAYALTLVFRDSDSAQTVAARRIEVVGALPGLAGDPPGPGSKVFRDLLSCPRSVV